MCPALWSSSGEILGDPLRAAGGAALVPVQIGASDLRALGRAPPVPHRRYSCVMRPLRYSINITLDGCCDHRAGSTDEELHCYWAENLAQADALLFGRVTYEMMEAAWRLSPTGVRPSWMTDWMEPFAR